MTRWIRSLAVAVAVSASVIACNESTGPRPIAAGITLSVENATVIVGQTLQLTIRVEDETGRQVSGVPLRFQSSDTSVAIVTNSGLVRGRRPGRVEVSATADSVRGSIEIDVVLPPCPLSVAPTTMTVNTTVNGSSATLDCFFIGAGYADAYQIAVTSATSLLFKMHTPDRTSEVAIFSSSGAEVARGGSFQPGDTARTIATVGAGTYFVYAIVEDPEAPSFTLRATPASACTAANNTGLLNVGETVSGTLTSSSCLFRNNGAPGQSWTIAQTDGNPITLGVRGAGFQPYILLLNSNFEPFYFSSPITADSTQLTTQLPLGNYYAMVTSINADVGAFTLTRTAPTQLTCTTPTDTITPPATLAGELSTTDCMYEIGFYTDPILLDVTAAAQSLRIDQASEDFDSYLTVTDLAGNVLAVNDDASVTTLDSRVTLTLPQGKYIIYPSSYDASTVGSYTLTVTVTAGVQGPSLRSEISPRDPAKRGQRPPIF